ncbi:MAG: hypothetical protein ABH833_02580 [Parcubacteria group bacterium]
MVLVKYLIWHYSIAPRNIVAIMLNYVVGTWHNFLIVRHLRTLFAPWHRTKPEEILKPKTLGDKMGNFVVDIFIRLIAAVLRLGIVLTGLIYEILIIAVFIVFLVVWLAWPAILVLSIRQFFV